jgi:hypothetical protein
LTELPGRPGSGVGRSVDAAAKAFSESRRVEPDVFAEEAAAEQQLFDGRLMCSELSGPVVAQPDFVPEITSRSRLRRGFWICVGHRVTRWLQIDSGQQVGRLVATR